MLKYGRRVTLLGVLHIPSLARNLISISKMNVVGVQTMFEKDTCKMVQGAMVLILGIRIGTLYKLLGRTDNNSFHQVVDPNLTNEILSCIDDSTMLWHQRLGHIDEKGLRAIHNKGIVDGLPNCSFEFDFYEHYIYGQQNCVSFPNKATRAKGILELVHSDLFGPVLLPSLRGSRYYVSFINDFSRMTWIYFLNKNS